MSDIKSLDDLKEAVTGEAAAVEAAVVREPKRDAPPMAFARTSRCIWPTGW